MSGVERRKKIVELLRGADKALSGNELGKRVGVTRQIVVQDIALLRSEGTEIISTARGYRIEGNSEEKYVSRIIKVRHTADQVFDELAIIVDLGGGVKNVFVNHKIYGKIYAPLKVKSRRDAQKFVEGIETGKSTPLLNLTAGYHFHTIYAESEEILDEIDEALEKKGFLAELTPFEKENL